MQISRDEAARHENGGLIIEPICKRRRIRPQFLLVAANTHVATCMISEASR